MRPVPWLTDGACYFLAGFLQAHGNARVLEFGAGASTLWIARRTRSLWSVEHKPDWHRKVNDSLQLDGLCANVMFRHLPYQGAACSFGYESMDLILVDGRERVDCARAAARLVAHRGVLMLDNDERPRYKPVHEFLKHWHKTSAEQIGPDQTGWQHKHPEGKWITTWWTKPST